MTRELLAVLWALPMGVPVWRRTENVLRVGEAYRTNRDLSWLGVHECLESDTCVVKLSSPARIQGDGCAAGWHSQLIRNSIDHEGTSDGVPLSALPS
jgi:hypothetical protein